MHIRKVVGTLVCAAACGLSGPSLGAAPGVAVAPAVTPAATPAQVIQVLDQTVDWYRTLGMQQQTANEPSELLILYDNRQAASQVIVLAFDIARANADLLSHAPSVSLPRETDAGISSQAVTQLRTKLDGQVRAIQTERDNQQRDLSGASKGNKVQLQAKLNELQSELDLVNTKKTILDTMANFLGGAAGSAAGSLKAQIDAMAVAIPPAGAAPGTQATGTLTSAPAPAPALFAPSPVTVSNGKFGLWDLAANAIRLSQKSSTIDVIDHRTAALQNTLVRMRMPLIDQIKALSAQGDALAVEADSADSATLNGVRNDLDALAERFKQTSALLIPVTREAILLAQYRRNLDNWRDLIKTQYHDAWRTLAIRIGMVAIVLALLFGAAELWRRAVLHYIQDSRRRYQLLLLRRIALWSLVVIVIGLAFASELGSIVTFAGLLTAGIAVAMQSVLVSIVGYFFLIGKYGIRVGDRVQIGEVAGEVIDLGLVRMYLMELGSKGAAGPTGRVVAFANSVVFQVASGLFKQIPGVNFAWRDITLSLPAGADYGALKERLLAALTEALKDYRAEIHRQTQEIERATLSASAVDAVPQVQLQFSAGGVEARVRYPVHLPHAAEIDERVTEALAKVVAAATVGSGVSARAG